MYKIIIPPETTINFNESYEAEPIEMKVTRMMNNNEPITDAAEVIYTERKDGVLPQFDIRTDRFDIAIEAADALHKSKIAAREERQKLAEQAKEGMQKEIGKPEPIQGTK